MPVEPPYTLTVAFDPDAMLLAFRNLAALMERLAGLLDARTTEHAYTLATWEDDGGTYR